MIYFPPFASVEEYEKLIIKAMESSSSSVMYVDSSDSEEEEGGEEIETIPFPDPMYATLEQFDEFERRTYEYYKKNPHVAPSAHLEPGAWKKLVPEALKLMAKVHKEADSVNPPTKNDDSEYEISALFEDCRLDPSENAQAGSEVGNSSIKGKAPSSHVPLSVSGPSSNYNNWLQQATGTQKAASDKSSEASEVDDERIDQQPRNQYNALEIVKDEDHHSDHLSSSSNNNIPENLSVSGFIPPMIGTQLTSFETDESHTHDASQVPNFVVQQPFDPASSYAQFYPSGGADVDGRVSPFHSTRVPSKYNGNISVFSPPASHSSQEAGNSLMLLGAGPTPIATAQTGGFMQTSMAVTQQPLPVFRQPTGVHLPHYPPSYVLCGPYFSPIYVPPPPFHQFMSYYTFPQQLQAGSMYPDPPVASPKYPLPQYKMGSNTGNPVNTGMPGSYGPYGLNPAGYNSGSAATAGNSFSDEGLGGTQFKESNV